jgi:hypothetical protein
LAHDEHQGLTNMTEKRVRVTIELDPTAIRLLNANIELSGGITVTTEEDIDVRHVLALITIMEARGAMEEQIALAIPDMWADCLRVIHEERRVYDEQGKQLSGPELVPMDRQPLKANQEILENPFD